MHRSITRRRWPHLFALLAIVMLAVPAQAATTYTNPLLPAAPGKGEGVVESCADPSTIYNPADRYWYTFCTKDPLNDTDRNAAGEFIFNNIPILRSSDLINWTYIGNVFDVGRNFPAWAEPIAGLFAPAIEYMNGQYYLYYSVTNTKLEARDDDSAIGVATSSSPAGPWVDSGTPVVEPTEAYCCPGSRRATIDPDVVEADGQKYIFWGSFFGGISARKLSADGLTSDKGSQQQITIDNRYEAPYIVQRDGYYYLFVSAANCCNGALSGYTVFAGRSQNILGPYVDREGVSLLEPRVGGTIVLAQNGNDWVGPGHNAVFQDFSGQWWTTYHAIDRNEPYFANANGFTKRPLFIDPVDWIDGWPTVRGGKWVSDTPQPAPAAQPGTTTTYRPTLAQPDQIGRQIKVLSDEFNARRLGPRWEWVRQPSQDQYSVGKGGFDFNTQPGDLYVDSNNAPVLTEPAPPFDYAVETRVKLDAPLDKCPPECNFTQAGLVIYGDDDNFIKLVDVSIYNTRQTEFAKELAPVPAGYARYGNAVVGPPAEWTLLRIVKRTRGNEELYTAYTKRDVRGGEWVRGATWTHTLGDNARIGLVSFGGTGYRATFDYVRVYELSN